MKLLLDEDVPKQLLEPLRHLLPNHEVDHVDDLGWKGKKERINALRPTLDTDVQIRSLTDYDTALGIDGGVA